MNRLFAYYIPLPLTDKPLNVNILSIMNEKVVNFVSDWFYNPNIQFHMWDVIHITTLFFIVIFIFLIYLNRKNLILYRNFIRITVAILLLISRFSLDIWYLTTDNWSLNHSLPLELCSMMSICAAIMLLTKNKFLFEIVYFVGIGGTIQALVTPNLFFGYPQFRYIQFFLDHFLLILAPLLMIWLYEYTITKSSIVRAFLAINVLALIVFFINSFIDANYMFLKRKPSTPSLLDLLGSYPYYLLSLELITLIVFLILYVPFIRKE